MLREAAVDSPGGRGGAPSRDGCGCPPGIRGGGVDQRGPPEEPLKLRKQSDPRGRVSGGACAGSGGLDDLGWRGTLGLARVASQGHQRGLEAWRRG